MRKHIAGGCLVAAGGIENVNRSIGEMDRVTQHNAALVEEASAAAQAMQEQAGQLARAVRVFRLDPDQAAVGGGVERLALGRY